MNLWTRGAGVAKWWKYLPPANVAQIHFKSHHRPRTRVEFRVVKSSQLPEKIAAYLVSMGQLLCLAILYGWHFFLNKILLDWLLTLTTQPSTSKLSDNPVTLLLVLSGLFCYERSFSLYSGFPLSSKTNISNFQFIQNGRRKTHLNMDVLPQNCYNAFIYLFIYLLQSQKKNHRVCAQGNKLLPAYNLKDKGL